MEVPSLEERVDKLIREVESVLSCKPVFKLLPTCTLHQRVVKANQVGIELLSSCARNGDTDGVIRLSSCLIPLAAFSAELSRNLAYIAEVEL
mmetsp:Transcript_10969/g.21473  ORF Transcript_10969/g.21473 Transcript_10969/m.21473 type:complete len:92 (-) Transcript_10969:13-288(-)